MRKKFKALTKKLAHANRKLNLFVEAMAEVKASDDGDNGGGMDKPVQSIKHIIEGLLKELDIANAEANPKNEKIDTCTYGDVPR
jgi:hypothetical protein